MADSGEILRLPNPSSILWIVLSTLYHIRPVSDGWAPGRSVSPRFSGESITNSACHCKIECARSGGEDRPHLDISRDDQIARNGEPGASSELQSEVRTAGDKPKIESTVHIG